MRTSETRPIDFGLFLIGISFACALRMGKRSARRDFVSTWMLEFSVLWAVFPLLDQLLSGHLDYKVLALACVIVVTCFWAGWALAGDEGEEGEDDT